MKGFRIKKIFLGGLIVLGAAAGVVLISSNSAFGAQTREHSEKGITFRDKIARILKLDSEILEAHRGDLDQMLKTGRIRVLTTYSYGNFFIHEGQTHGFEYSIMEE